MLLFTAWRKWLNLLSGAVRGDRRASLRPIHKRRWRLAVERLEDRTVPAFNMTLSLAAQANVTRTVLATTATYEATATGANVNWADIGTDMAAGLNVVVTSGATGTEAGNITDQTGNSIANAATTSLTFQSGSGTGLVGDITLLNVRLQGATSALVVSAANNVSTGVLDSGATGGAPLSSVSINSDVGPADPGVGSTITLNGNIIATTTTVTGGPDSDTIIFGAGVTLTNGTTPTGTVDGGGGTDTLDYSAYTTPVAVNLGLGTPGLTATLGADQEVPPTSSTATATATLSNYNPVTKTFDISLTATNFDPTTVTGFHLHRSPVGVNGPIIIDLLALAPLVPAGTGFTYNATGVSLATSLLGGVANEAAFLGGITYLNIHTGTFPNGAIRGQVFSTGNVSLATGTATGTASISNIENVIGGAGADSLIGTTAANTLTGNAGNDTMLGAPGADTLSGGDGDDVMIWSNGDGSDVMDGNAGNDLVQVNGGLGGAAINDSFTIGANGTRVAFARISTGPFTLDIGTTETLIVNGIAGTDTFTVNDLAGVADLTTVNLNGQADNDTFNVLPAPTVTINVVGGLPSTAPGDALTVTTTGIANPILSATSTPTGLQGSYTFNGRSPVNFTQIETLTPTTADLSITKVDNPDPAAPGTVVAYAIIVTNSGTLGVGGAVIADTFPAELTNITFSRTFSSANSSSSDPASGTGNINQTVNLAAGDTVTYLITATISPSATGTLSNTATVTPPSGVTDPTPGNNSATATTTLGATADLAVTKTATPSPITAGTTLTYTITVTNNGPSNAQNVTLTDPLPAGTVFISATVSQGSFTVTDTTLTATLGAIPNGGTATVTVLVQIPQATANQTIVSNTASVTSSATDPNPANDSATDTTSVIGPTTIGLFRPDTVTWFLRDSNTQGAPTTTPFAYGSPTSTPVMGDWNGDGITTVGVVDVDTVNNVLVWKLRNSNTPGAPDITPFAYGGVGAITVVGDWDGDGITTIGVVELDTVNNVLVWKLRNSNTPGAPDIVFAYGGLGATPVVGDWDGDGITTIGVIEIDPATNFFVWKLRNSNTPGAPDITPFAYGAVGQVPIVGDWNADGISTIGVFDPTTAIWQLRDSNTPGAPDIGPLAYGIANDKPVPGTFGIATALRAASPIDGAKVDPLSQEALDKTVAAALDRLRNAGVDKALLSQLGLARFEVGALSGGMIGTAFVSTNRVLIDANAAGVGWFVDATPDADEEFAVDSGGALTAGADSPAAGQLDLLTTVLHEFGHLAGLGDLKEGAGGNDLMGELLANGTRLTGALDKVFAQGKF